jgi:hypothetical protein
MRKAFAQGRRYVATSCSVFALAAVASSPVDMSLAADGREDALRGLDTPNANAIDREASDSMAEVADTCMSVDSRISGSTPIGRNQEGLGAEAASVLEERACLCSAAGVRALSCKGVCWKLGS